jgi:hypothetical protein
MVTRPLPVLKSKVKHCMAEEPLQVQRVFLIHPFEIGLTAPDLGHNYSFVVSTPASQLKPPKPWRDGAPEASSNHPAPEKRASSDVPADIRVRSELFEPLLLL